MHRLVIAKSAVKEMDALPDAVFLKIDKAISSLKRTPRPFPQSKKLSGDNRLRLRVGDYRVIYTVDDKEEAVTICRVRHRREAYRQ